MKFGQIGLSFLAFLINQTEFRSKQVELSSKPGFCKVHSTNITPIRICPNFSELHQILEIFFPNSTGIATPEFFSRPSNFETLVRSCSNTWEEETYWVRAIRPYLAHFPGHVAWWHIVVINHLKIGMFQVQETSSRRLLNIRPLPARFLGKQEVLDIVCQACNHKALSQANSSPPWHARCNTDVSDRAPGKDLHPVPLDHYSDGTFNALTTLVSTFSPFPWTEAWDMSKWRDIW
jgi:hypothetical protein